MKIRKIFCVLCSVFLFGCNSSNNINSDISSLHSNFVDSSAPHQICDNSNRQCQEFKTADIKGQGDTWEGNWLFTVKNGDRELKDYTIIAKAEYQNGKLMIGEKIQPSSLSDNQIVYAGFTNLSKSSSENITTGYDVITNANNEKFPLSKIKVNGNNLSWELVSDGKQRIFSVPMIFKTKAKYLPEKDKLKGITKFGMNYTIEKGGRKQIKYVEMGTYLWEASRIEESAFEMLTKPEAFITTFPLYLVGVNPNKVDF